MVSKKGFTIIELLVTVAIIGLMVGLLIPNIDRSLDKNQIVNDVDIFKAKLEETRLLAGSTQQEDNTEGSVVTDVGYYAVAIPSSSATYFDIVRVSNPLTGECTPDDVVTQVNSDEGICTVERVSLSENITLSNGDSDIIIAYKVPTQKFLTITRDGAGWEESSPVFNTPIFNLNYLSSHDVSATINLDDYTGRVTASYTTN